MTTRRMKTLIGDIGYLHNRMSNKNLINNSMRKLTGSNTNDNKRSSEDIDTMSMRNKNVNTKNTEEDSVNNNKPVRKKSQRKSTNRE